MRRAIHLGLFIGIVIGMSACAPIEGPAAQSGPYGVIEAGRSN